MTLHGVRKSSHGCDLYTRMKRHRFSRGGLMSLGFDQFAHVVSVTGEAQAICLTCIYIINHKLFLDSRPETRSETLSVTFTRIR